MDLVGELYIYQQSMGCWIFGYRICLRLMPIFVITVEHMDLGYRKGMVQTLGICL